MTDAELLETVYDRLCNITQINLCNYDSEEVLEMDAIVSEVIELIAEQRPKPL